MGTRNQKIVILPPFRSATLHQNANPLHVNNIPAFGQLVRFRYEEGLAVITDLLDASNQLLDAQIQEVNAKMNIAYNYYRLQYISGTI